MSSRIITAVFIASLAVLVAGGVGIYLSATAGGDDILPYRLTYTRKLVADQRIYMIERDGDASDYTKGAGSDSQPAWSSDGKQLVFVRDNALFLRDENERPLTDPLGMVSPAWSPDGSKIAYSYQGPDTTSRGFLWVMNSDGSDQHLVFSKPPEECRGGFAAGWFADGRILYRGSFPDGSLAICSVAPDGTDVRTIIHDDTGEFEYYSPALSPDGTKLAYTRRQGTASAIFISNADGSDAHRLFGDDTGQEDYAAWSPDSQWVAFVSSRTGAAKVHMAHPDGSGLLQVTTDEGSDSYPAWVPND
jgi:Tol biopolymer transport system component